MLSLIRFPYHCCQSPGSSRENYHRLHRTASRRIELRSEKVSIAECSSESGERLREDEKKPGGGICAKLGLSINASSA